MESIYEKIGEIREGRYFPNESNNGYCYKDEEAYVSGKGICYIPEYGFDSRESLNEDEAKAEGYTREDILRLCEGKEGLADDAFSIVDWQCIETYLNEYDDEGYWD